MFFYKFQGKKFKSLDKIIPLIPDTVRYYDHINYGVVNLEVYHDNERLACVNFYVGNDGEIAGHFIPYTDLFMLMIRAEDRMPAKG